VNSSFERQVTGRDEVDGEFNDLRARRSISVERGKVRDKFC